MKRWKRTVNHAILVMLEKHQKKVKQTVDWYKSKHRTSDYFGSPLIVRVSRVSRIVKRWNIGASTSEAEKKGKRHEGT